MKERQVPTGSCAVLFRAQRGEPKESLNQEDGIRSVLGKIMLLAVGVGWGRPGVTRRGYETVIKTIKTKEA